MLHALPGAIRLVVLVVTATSFKYIWRERERFVTQI